MSAKIDISPEQLDIVQAILRTHLPKGTLAWAFGSRVTWTAKPFSDLDLAIEAAAPLPLRIIGDLQEAFENSDLPWRVDVIDLKSVSPEFRAIVERQRVPADWVSSELFEICDPDRKITYGIVQPGQLHEEGIPIVRVNNFRGNGLDLTDRLAVAPDIEMKYVRSRPRAGDLLISLVGTIGQLAIAPAEISGWNLARAVGLIPFANKVTAEWAFYSLQTAAAQDFINQRANTTVQTTFNLKDLASIPVFLPPEWEQKQIISILKTLDDKIELNRQMNQTLEALARAVFEDWFVAFGPTRRKMVGETDPAAILGGLLPPETATPLAPLFPDQFGENGLPLGWDVRSLGEVSTLLKRGMTPKYAESGPLVVNQRCIRNGWIDFSLARRHDNQARALNDRELQVGDVLVNSTGVGTLGRVATVRYLSEQTTADTHVTIVRPNTKMVAQIIVALFVEWKEPEIEQLGHGSTGQTELSPSVLAGLNLNLPSLQLQKCFQEVISALRETVVQNEQENQTLAATRDLLLPKLMSGELRLLGGEGGV